MWQALWRHSDNSSHSPYPHDADSLAERKNIKNNVADNQQTAIVT